jgi:hypothetical protein
MQENKIKFNFSKEELEIKSRICNILEKTKFDHEKYKDIRKLLFDLETLHFESKASYDYWNDILSSIEKNIKLDKKSH